MPGIILHMSGFVDALHRRMDVPACSLDLSPIENVRPTMKGESDNDDHKLSSRCLVSGEIGQSSIPKHSESAIKRKGDVTKW